MAKKTINVFVAKSWNDLFQLLFEVEPRMSTGRFRSRFVFRGVANAVYIDLPTSLQRLTDKTEHLPKLEAKLIRAFKKYAYLEGPQSELTWEWLSIAQHYGLPTRLLDWTWSPMVAMHFATDKNFDSDGVIWMVDFRRAINYLPKKMRDVADEESTTMFTTSMLQSVAPTLESFDSLRPKQRWLTFFEPPSLDSRIANQYGLFSVMNGAATRLEEWLDTKPDLYKKVIIPAALKWEVRDKLDQANITERVMFPGLSGVAGWLKRYYGPGGV